jgi:hypothetical protein
VIFDPVRGQAEYQGNVIEFMEKDLPEFPVSQGVCLRSAGIGERLSEIRHADEHSARDCHADSFVNQEEKIAS